jgi:hypothetical protein
MKQKTAERKNLAGIIRQINLFFYFLTGLFTIISCSPNAGSEPEKQMQQSVIKENDLSEDQRMEWISFLKEWQINEFNSLLKSSDFRQDCVDCGNIVWDVQLHIDANGKCSKVDLIKRNVECSQKSDEQIQNLEKKVLASFKEKKFPDSFKSLNLEVKIGRASKC